MPLTDEREIRISSEFNDGEKSKKNYIRKIPEEENVENIKHSKNTSDIQQVTNVQQILRKTSDLVFYHAEGQKQMWAAHTVNRSYDGRIISNNKTVF